MSDNIEKNENNIINNSKEQKYTADDIRVIDPLEAVRLRPGMYIGTTASAGLHHLIWEILDNSIDEALAGYGKKVIVTLHKDGSCSVLDEGRGVPVGINKDTGKSAIELVYTVLHAGGKFSDKVYSSSAGLHGVGASVVNALSSWCEVTVYRDNVESFIRFVDGGKIDVPLKTIGPTKKRGTYVRFLPDNKIFPSIDFKWETVFNHLQESAFLLKGIKFVLIDEKNNQTQEFCYENGLVEYVANINQNKESITDIMYFSDIDNDSKIQMNIAMQFCKDDYNESIYSYCNNVRTRDGGTHEAGFRTGITRAVNDFAEQNKLLKNKKLEGSDIREGLTAVISVIVPEKIIQFEGQTKEKLGTAIAAPVVNNFIYNQMTYYLTENREIALSIIKKCVDSQQVRIAARKARDDARNSKKAKTELILSDKLTPAQSKDYKNNELFIVEGNSAGGTARKGRDKIHQAILPLRGKPLNTDSIALDKLLKNEEISTIISTVGAGFGASFDVSDIKYGKIIIMTDADTDGAHIQTLLLTFFYHYMRPLITSGHVYVAMPPLYHVFKEVNHKTIQEYAWDDEGLEKAKKKIGADYKIGRYKGLGEMDAVQLKETTMDPKTRTLIQVSIDDFRLVENRVGVLMGKDTQVRKKWVEENVDFNIVDNFLKENNE